MKATEGFPGGTAWNVPPRQAGAGQCKEGVRAGPATELMSVHGSVLVLIVSEERQRTVLVMSTERTNPKWRLPGGGIVAGETPEEAGAREVEEETGIPLQASAITVLLPERREKHRYWPHLCAAQVSEEDFDHVLAQTLDDDELLVTRVLEVNELLHLRDLLQPHRERLEEAFPSPQWAA